MVAKRASPHFVKRDDPITLPTGVGISGVAIATNTALPTTSGLAVDPEPSSLAQTAPAFTIIQSTAANPQTAATSPTAVSSGPPPSIPLRTVIGSCVGAFVGISAIVILFIWFYRRYSQSLREQAKTRLRAHDRNLQTDKERRRSRRRSWNKLEDGGDRWEDMHKTREVDQVVPMEKLTMFKRGASIRTAYTQRSVDAPLTYPQSFAPFDTNLVRTLSADNIAVSLPQSSQDPIKSQILSDLPPSSISLGGPLSPMTISNMAIPTPEATVLDPHRWESAEVIHYAEGQTVEIVLPSDRQKDAKSSQNPFFGSQDYSRSRSDPASNGKPLNTKGEERLLDSMVSSGPSEEQIPTSVPILVHHQTTDSSSSTQSKDRAMQALMVALELSEDEVRERLRVASMQPSVISQLSQYSNLDEEEFLNTIHLPPYSGNLKP